MPDFKEMAQRAKAAHDAATEKAREDAAAARDARSRFVDQAVAVLTETVRPAGAAFRETGVEHKPNRST